ncbi:MAG: hypothetical protein JKY65_31860, partial [Planctomycetes bacterium]|nr:hypothetical protein [Planctomycetota bacterium]
MSVLLIHPDRELESVVRRIAAQLDLEVTDTPSQDSTIVIFSSETLPPQGDLDRLRAEIGPAAAFLTGDADTLAAAVKRSWEPLVLKGLLFRPLDEARLTEQLLTSRPPDSPASARPEGVLLISQKEQLAVRLKEFLPESSQFAAVATLGDAWRLCREHRYRAILIDLVLTHRRTWERIKALQPGALTLALIQRRHSGGSRTMNTRCQRTLVVPFVVEQLTEAIADALIPEVPIEDGVRRVPGGHTPEVLQAAVLRALGADAGECLGSRVIDLGAVSLYPEQIEELRSGVEAGAKDLGIEVTWH